MMKLTLFMMSLFFVSNTFAQSDAMGTSRSRTFNPEGIFEPYSFGGDYSHSYHPFAGNTDIEAEISKREVGLELFTKKVRAAYRTLRSCNYVYLDPSFSARFPEKLRSKQREYDQGVITRQHFYETWAQAEYIYPHSGYERALRSSVSSNTAQPEYMVLPILFLKNKGYEFNEQYNEWIPKKGKLENCPDLTS